MIIAFAGRIGKDAEVRTTQGGDSVTQFSVGCNVGRDKTAWIDCSMWGERGEKLAQYLTKGTAVGINGRPAVRAYTKNGEAVGVQQCVVNHVDLLGSKRDSDSGSRDDAPARQQGGGPVDLGDDVPFAPEWR
jgi:single-strand DNA-binding protein